GAHATTRLVLQFLLALPRGSLLDLGCGSGVVALAAAKLGFAPVTAFDCDGAAVDATRENARANAVELEARRSDVLAAVLPAAGLAVANIDLRVVSRLAARLEVGRLVTSGYPARDRLLLPGWRHVERRELEGWAADLFTCARPAP
ncbi:MAG: 50S ribosomal protein L11 methyltransferase, partial [Thermoleophilia bacterium]|nr:50S ribosomal protein L11 methyltransferase [Thermoleophilia bacterium]